MPLERQRVTIDGNEAAAYIAHHVPSSAMGEWADQRSASGSPNIWGSVPTVVEMQSEAGAAGAVHEACAMKPLSTARSPVLSPCSSNFARLLRTAAPAISAPTTSCPFGRRGGHPGTGCSEKRDFRTNPQDEQNKELASKQWGRSPTCPSGIPTRQVGNLPHSETYFFSAEMDSAGPMPTISNTHSTSLAPS